MLLTTYVFDGINLAVTWSILFDETFETEFRSFATEVQVELMARAGLLAEIGPSLGRPSVDTLKGSKHANMKEIRFSAGDGVWRVAFAFDPKRQAILLVAGDKSGTSQKRFYRDLIGKADDRFSRHLKRTKG